MHYIETENEDNYIKNFIQDTTGYEWKMEEIDGKLAYKLAILSDRSTHVFDKTFAKSAYVLYKDEKYDDILDLYLTSDAIYKIENNDIGPFCTNLFSILSDRDSEEKKEAVKAEFSERVTNICIPFILSPKWKDRIHTSTQLRLLVVLFLTFSEHSIHRYEIFQSILQFLDQKPDLIDRMNDSLVKLESTYAKWDITTQ